MVKKPLNIARGSKITKSGIPTSEATSDIIASHLPKSGTCLYEYVFLLKPETLSQLQPTGHRLLQNHRFLNKTNNRIMRPRLLRKTSDLRANTELSIIKGLSQINKPVNPFNDKGTARISATRKETVRRLKTFKMIFIQATLPVV
jgi:hypothetical protein